MDGPLGDYHSSIILDAWRQGLQLNDALCLYKDEEYWNYQYHNTARESLKELRLREKVLDIEITSYIESHQHEEQLFFTFNHPSKRLIAQLAQRIGSHLNLKSRYGARASIIKEALDQFQPPIHSFTKKQLKLNFRSSEHFAVIDKNIVGTKRFRTITLEEIIQDFYQIYDKRKDDILNLDKLEPTKIQSWTPFVKPSSNIENVLRLYSQLKFKDCLEEAKGLIKREPSHLRAHCIALQACQHLEDASEVNLLIHSGLHHIEKGRQMFLTSAFEVVAHFKLNSLCRKIANELKVISTRTNQPELNLYKLRALEIQNKPKKAIQQSYRLKNHYPENLLIQLELARLLKRHEQFQKASQEIKQLTKQFPDYWEGHDLHCEALLRRKKQRKAKEYLQTVFSNSSNKLENDTTTKNQNAPLHIIQYFAHNPDAALDEKKRQYIDLMNQKISLQWRCSLGNHGSYQLLDRSAAITFLQKHHDNSVLEAFLQCGPPAMQADVLRVAHLAHHSHALYIDWPYRPFNIEHLLNNNLFKEQRSVLAGKPRPNTTNPWSIWNGFGYTTPEDNLRPFFQTILDEIVENIRKKISNNVFIVTGPGLWESVYERSPEVKRKIKTINYPHDVHEIFLPALDKRKSMRGHWSTIQRQESIFTSTN